MSADASAPGGASGAMRNMENHEAYNIIEELQKDGKMEPKK